MKTDRQRDAEMDRLLGSALRTAAGVPAGDCPAAGNLAAFVEGSLSNGERRRLEDHLADCEACQQALAVMARMPADEVRPVPARGTWLPAHWVRWLAPAGAVAGLLFLYVVVRPAFQPTAPDTRVALSTAPAAVQAPVEPGDRLTPAPAARLIETPPVDRETHERPLAGRTVQPRTASKGPTQLTSTRPKAEPLARAEVAKAVPPSKAAEQATATAATPQKLADAAAPKAVVLDRLALLPPDLKIRQTKAMPARSPDAAALAAPVQPPAAAPAQPPAAAPSSATAPGAAGVAATQPTFRVGALAETVAVSAAPPKPLAQTAGPGAILVRAPDGRTEWQFQRGAAIWRTTDAGKYWQMQRPAGTGDLLAGIAPDSLTCWAVGREGLVLLTRNGERWESRPFPERVDLVGVAASDGRTATVTARDGRRFTTTDGGATWHPLS